jgi:hypothetical protein
MKRLAVAILLIAAPAIAQQNPQGYFMTRYDLDATAITYCRSNGKGGSPYGAPLSGPGQVTNAASSTTITGADLTADVFTAIAAGDTIYIHDGATGTTYARGVVTRTDADNVVVDEAVDLGGSNFGWTWRDQTCGTAVTDGWVSAAGLENLSVGLFFKQISDDGSGIDVRLEGTIHTPDGTTNIMQIWPSKDPAAANTVQNFTTAGLVSNMIVNVTAPIDSLRVGMFFNSADDAAGDVTTDAEQITVVLFGQQGGR